MGTAGHPRRRDDHHDADGVRGQRGPARRAPEAAHPARTAPRRQDHPAHAHHHVRWHGGAESARCVPPPSPARTGVARVAARPRHVQCRLVDHVARVQGERVRGTGGEVPGRARPERDRHRRLRHRAAPDVRRPPSVLHRHAAVARLVRRDHRRDPHYPAADRAHPGRGAVPAPFPRGIRRLRRARPLPAHPGALVTAPASTLLLTRSEVDALLDPAACLPLLRTAFVDYSANRGHRARRVRADLPGPGSATVLFPGTAPGVPAYTVKVHAKFPTEEPAIRGVLCLHSSATGALLAIMDSTHLTAVRTGVAGALAAHVLARPEADTVAVVGAGVQGTHQLRSLAALREVRAVRVFDSDPQRASAFASAMTAELGTTVDVADALAPSLRGAGVVLAATWAREPFILPGMLDPGTHVTTLGPDEPGKAEVAAEVIRAALFVCDDRTLAVEMGALAGVGLGPEAVGAELGEVLSGVHPGRTSPEQLTVYGGVGLAFQDVVAASAVYEAARRLGTGREIDFLA